MKRQRPFVFFTTSTPFAAKGLHFAPPGFQETEAHFGFFETVEIRTAAHLGGSSAALAIWRCCLAVGALSACATAGHQQRRGHCKKEHNEGSSSAHGLQPTAPACGLKMDRAPVLETRLPGVSAAVGSGQACLHHMSATA